MNATTSSHHLVRANRTLHTVALLCLFTLVLGAAAEAQRNPRVRSGEGRWTLLGSKKVTDRVETDVIRVAPNRGRFSAIKIRVQDKGVEFRKVVVHFRNGKRREVDLRRVIPAGGESRVIELAPGGSNLTAHIDGFRIERIVMTYDAQSLGGRQALVKVLARR